MRLVMLFACAVVLGIMLSGRSDAESLSAAKPAAFVHAMLDQPASVMDFAQAKLAIDKFADPSIDAEAALAEINRMAATVRKMIATLPAEAVATSLEKMQALRAFLYEPGWWNDNQPFQYDLADPYGQERRQIQYQARQVALRPARQGPAGTQIPAMTIR